MGRIKKKIEENLAEDQFGFRKNRGTREVSLCLRNIVEKSQHMISFCGTTGKAKSFKYEGESNENLKSAIKIRKTARLSCELTTAILTV